jgi:hypothetical protein
MQKLSDGMLLYHGSYTNVSVFEYHEKMEISRFIFENADADEICIAQLIPERLKDQYCFRTNAALECLSFVGSEKVWIN